MERELQLLNEANVEIKRLRQRNYLMQARLEMFDNMMQLLNTRPPDNTVGMSPDLTYEIDKFIESKKPEQ